MRFIVAILIFSFIIIFHEFGHFLLAKLNGVTVLEFSLGMGPRLFSFVRGGTRWSLKLLPLGGSCMMLGEDGEDEQVEGSFSAKPAWRRILIVAAGPVFNFILAWIMSAVIIGSFGYDKPEILAVSEGLPAEAAGLLPGDVITSINGSRVYLYREVADYTDFHQRLYASGKPVTIGYTRDGEKGEVSIVPVDSGTGRYVLGISGNSNMRTRAGILKTALYSCLEVRYWIRTTFMSLRMLVTGSVSLNDMTGPVGVVSIIGDTYQESLQDGAFYVFLNMLNIAILLSANLGVMNLLPIPALDGGRLIFLLVELVRRKRIDPDTEAKIHIAGFMLLMVLMVVVMFNDIRRLF